ncbi:short-chain dehydrogenase [Bacillus sp. FJAT-50079]|uniref:short-chain dehydrogenase n=1 Tax=Bacillus sp. FJAT-50079 TaxID=2833577 RepID=UPI001BC95776|nr:short-chain dehydrogenase [Bacillus sp. FJAT-50079]MBS4209461.1 short-chain dehydrogenase [Bacillus sp. FJAT-50079]
MKHALIVGGTGMLANVSHWLVANGYHVSVIGRNQVRMEKFLERIDSKEVTPIIVDYINEKELRERLQQSIRLNHPINLVVAWIHTIAPDALKAICHEVSLYHYEWSLFHVLGSSSNIEDIKQKTAVPPFCQYHQIQLGFINEGNQSRWLTHQEISNGVIEAIQQKKSVHTVGVIEPWEKRPY